MSFAIKFSQLEMSFIIKFSQLEMSFIIKFSQLETSFIIKFSQTDYPPWYLQTVLNFPVKIDIYYKKKM